ncbi:hypothetical protein [Streptomyces sp. NRRL F-5053]|nr:hypothetical protein [Streptomyces sp. NRRL F-5053]
MSRMRQRIMSTCGIAGPVWLCLIGLGLGVVLRHALYSISF